MDQNPYESPVAEPTPIQKDPQEPAIGWMFLTGAAIFAGVFVLAIVAAILGLRPE